MSEQEIGVVVLILVCGVCVFLFYYAYWQREMKEDWRKLAEGYEEVINELIKDLDKTNKRIHRSSSAQRDTYSNANITTTKKV